MLGGFGILLKSILKRLKMNNKDRFLHYIHTEIRTGVWQKFNFNSTVPNQRLQATLTKNMKSK